MPGRTGKTTRRTFCATAAAGLASLTSCVTGAALPARKPNLVLYISDDHGMFFTGCYGNKSVRTPVMDGLAREGMRFTAAYTATAMCAPSRSMLYTGLYPHRNGAHQNHSQIQGSHVTLPVYLKQLGYRVALAGKIHVGPEQEFPFEYVDFEAAGDFIRSAQDEPFCLIVASKEPHTPHATGGYQPEDVALPPYLVDTPETRQRVADYCTDIDILDGQLGAVLKALEANALVDNTLFIYTSDHGEPLPFGKWTLYEAGLRVPFIARWPGVIPPNSTCNARLSFVDVLPTFIELAGGAAPDNIDGRSFAPVLSNEVDHHRMFIFGTHTNDGINNGVPYPIRSVSDGLYKYIVNLAHETSYQNNIVVGNERFGPLWNSWIEKARNDAQAASLVEKYLHRPAEELYALREDPYELHDVALDPGLAAIKSGLRRELARWMAEQNDPHAAKLG